MSKVTRKQPRSTIPAIMPDFHKAVLESLKRKEWSNYQLVQALKGKRKDGKDVPPATVYDFLRGDTTINSEYLGLIFDALEMTISPPKKK